MRQHLEALTPGQELRRASESLRSWLDSYGRYGPLYDMKFFEACTSPGWEASVSVLKNQVTSSFAQVLNPLSSKPNATLTLQ